MKRSHLVKQLSICIHAQRLGCSGHGRVEVKYSQKNNVEASIQAAAACRRGAFFGIVIVTLVPLPGVDAMPMLPPSMPVTTL